MEDWHAVTQCDAPVLGKKHAAARLVLGRQEVA